LLKFENFLRIISSDNLA